MHGEKVTRTQCKVWDAMVRILQAVVSPLKGNRDRDRGDRCWVLSWETGEVCHGHLYAGGYRDTGFTEGSGHTEGPETSDRCRTPLSPKSSPKSGPYR